MGRGKDRTVPLQNGPSPSAETGAIAAGGKGCLASAVKPRLRAAARPPDSPAQKEEGLGRRQCAPDGVGGASTGR